MRSVAKWHASPGSSANKLPGLQGARHRRRCRCGPCLPVSFGQWLFKIQLSDAARRSSFVIAPLDVVKIRLQLHVHALSGSASRSHGTLSTVKDMLREEGVTAFWKGNVPAEVLYLSYSAIQFPAYKYSSALLDAVPEPYALPSPVRSFVAGASAGACATMATYPLDLLRTRFAAQSQERVYTSILASIRDIGRHEGPQGFFRGLGAGVSQIIPYMGLFFASYEGLKPLLATPMLPLPWSGSEAIAGGLASILSKTAVYPLDTTRKRLQVQGPTRTRYGRRNIPQYRGVLRTVAHIWAHEGPRGMYRGLWISLAKAAPASAVTMWTYERTMGLLLAMEDRERDP